MKIEVLAEWDCVSAIRLLFSFKKRELPFILGDLPSAGEVSSHAVSLNEQREPFKPVLWEKRQPVQVVKQCASLGSHGDVDGGNTDAGLSTVALLWMVVQIVAACEARFDTGPLLLFQVPLQTFFSGTIRMSTWGSVSNGARGRPIFV